MAYKIIEHVGDNGLGTPKIRLSFSPATVKSRSTLAVWCHIRKEKAFSISNVQ